MNLILLDILNNIFKCFVESQNNLFIIKYELQINYIYLIRKILAQNVHLIYNFDNIYLLIRFITSSDFSKFNTQLYFSA